MAMSHRFRKDDEPQDQRSAYLKKKYYEHLFITRINKLIPDFKAIIASCNRDIIPSNCSYFLKFTNREQIDCTICKRKKKRIVDISHSHALDLPKIHPSISFVTPVQK